MHARFLPIAGILLVLAGCHKADPAPPMASAPPVDAWTRPNSPDANPISQKHRAIGGSRTKSASKPEAAKLAKGSVVQVRVTAITDGDTVRLLTSDKKEVKMRLNGIDAPESKMPFGAQAKGALSDLIFGKTVTAKIDGYDRYGRALGELTIGGASVNQRMVRDGYAWWYEAYAKKDHELETLQEQARSAKRGLWADPSPEEPWEWRKAKREK